MAKNSRKSSMAWKQGGCHCGAVKFEVKAPDEIELLDCNCSICHMTGYRHFIVAKSGFRLLQGKAKLASYKFNTGTATHRFCKVCGVKPFYIPRSHPDGYSVNFRCLNAEDFHSVLTTDFDGRNWERHIEELAPAGRGA
ncbi:MAG TPA: GFA family protein [Rhizomicrobium sp.]